MHLFDLLSILFRCNGLAGIHKAVVDQTGSRPPNSDHEFFGVSLALGSALELLLSSTTELVITGCHIKSTFVTRPNPVETWFSCSYIEKEKMTLQNDYFFDLWSAHEAPTYQALNLSNLLQISYDHRQLFMQL